MTKRNRRRINVCEVVMTKQGLPDILLDLAKVVGGVVRDTLDIGDYRVTVIIERKIDDKIGVVVENVSVDKRMSALEAEMFIKRLKELVEKK